MVFMGDRRSEQRHNAVPQHLVHRALVAMDSLHHDMDCRLQELLSGFGVEVLDQLGRVLDVGEKDSNLLALALQGTTGGQDLVGQKLGGVGLGLRIVYGRRFLGLPLIVAAGTTEFCTQGDFSSAVGTF